MRVWAWCWLVTSTLLVVGLAAVALTAPIWVEPRIERAGPVIVMPTKIDWSPWREELDVCRERTDHLRDVLERLIPTMPGREALPEAPGSWPPWPEPGVAHKWRKTGW